MTKFEQIGVNYQMDATSKKEARKCFNLSCKSCCNRGMRIDCDHCAIAQCHYSMIAAFDSLEQLESSKTKKEEVPSTFIISPGSLSINPDPEIPEECCVCNDNDKYLSNNKKVNKKIKPTSKYRK